MPGKGLFIQGATERLVESCHKLQSKLQEGLDVRATASTNSNHVSSRSHAVAIMTIRSYPKDDSDDMVVSQLYLADLAGSERVSKTAAAGQRLQEAGKINTSLLALRMVINKMTSASKRPASSRGRKASGKEKSYPVKDYVYRQSNLTRLLKHSFGGNARTAIFCTIAPTAAHSEESESTLLFGTQCQSIQNRVQANVVPKSTQQLRVLVRQQQIELEAAKAKIAQLEAQTRVPEQMDSDSIQTVPHAWSFCSNRGAGGGRTHMSSDWVLVS